MHSTSSWWKEKGKLMSISKYLAIGYHPLIHVLLIKFLMLSVCLLGLPLGLGRLPSEEVMAIGILGL
jgi:hypothetical protein